MSWFLLHKKGLSLVSPEGTEEMHFVAGTFEVADMLKDAGKFVINMDAERPPQPGKTPVKPPGTSTPAAKPKTKWSHSPNFSARGSTIGRVILHYTTAPEVKGTLAWFAKPESKVSAHYVIDRDGTIYQCVKDSDKAWHAKGENDNSIGIEHVATKGQRLTVEQAKASIELLRYLKAEYHLDNDDITAHRFTKSNIGHTDCPGDLWPTEADLKWWLNKYLSDDKDDGDSTGMPGPLPAVALNVPYFSQRDYGGELSNSICGATSVAMVLAYYAKGVNPDTVLDSHGKAACQTPEGCANVLRSYGLESTWTRIGSLSTIRALVAKGWPVIVHGWFTAPGHIMVICGFVGDFVICNDPAGVWDGRKGDSYGDNPPNGRMVRYPIDKFKAVISNDGDIWYSAAGR